MWDKMLKHWDDWSYPLRPSEKDCNIYKILLNRYYGRTLLLGKTQELKHLVTDSVDRLNNQPVDWFDLPYKYSTTLGITANLLGAA